MKLSVNDADVARKAVELGLIQAGESVPARLRARVVAALLQEQAPRPAAAEPQIAQEIVIQPGGAILVDGEPFPWLVAKEPMAVALDPHGVSTVRLTLFAHAVQIIKPEEKKED